ncbi:MAG: hypothetical protein WD552_00415, partial [Candidatus Paceibacterota bacterium]
TYLPFSVEDPEVIKETERQRTMELKKAIEDQLKETNWRLMSEGLSCRLGIMSGRIRVYESNDDIYNLIKRESK